MNPNRQSATTSPKSLSALVRIYQRKHAPQLAKYLGYFRKLDSIDDAIRFACHGRDGKIHGHQRRVGRAKLEQARRALQRQADRLKSSRSFDELIGLIERYTRSVERFGVLAVYDTSLRLGAYRRLFPTVVYVHAGTKKGCDALGVRVIGGTVEMSQLPTPLQALEPYEAEDFLCIFKDTLGGSSRNVGNCFPPSC